MAGGKERVLRRRIGSVQNTKKITRAMELIAATRVVKAQLPHHQLQGLLSLMKKKMPFVSWLMFINSPIQMIKILKKERLIF